MARILDGKAIAAETIETVKRESADLLKTRNIRPGLAVVIVGDDPASAIYVGSKERMARECGFHSIKKTMPEATSTDELASLVEQLNEDPLIHGILVQLPLPDHIDADRIVQTIAPQKDVDGFHYINVGKLVTGAMQTAHVPCTPSGCMVLIGRVRGVDLSGLHAVVLGRSNIVGKPMAHLLLAANATVTIAHSRTADLPGLCRTADILVAAVGRPQMVGADFIKPGATVIDVGINRLPPAEEGKKGRIVGDVDFDQVVDKAGAITRVPGGVGPMTIAMLMTATLRAARLSAA